MASWLPPLSAQTAGPIVTKISIRYVGPQNVSEAYRWAFTRQAQYGYAAAYAVLIFMLLAVGTRLLRGPSTAEATR